MPDFNPTWTFLAVFRARGARARIGLARTDATSGSATIKRAMKLALIGTHGVGKTTLAYDVCALLKKAGAKE